jgi:hypothetical protein
MKKVFTLLSLALCATIYAQKDNSYHNHWRGSNDNNIKLHTTEFIYSEKGKFYYFLSNDSENIYLNLRIYDPGVSVNVINTGLTVWINMGGKKTRKLGIKYPVGMQDIERPDVQNMQMRQGQQDMQGNQPFQKMPERGAPQGERKMKMVPFDKLELIGFSESKKTVISPFEDGNFRGSIKIEMDGNMWYELIMPISKLPEMTKKDKDREASFVLGIEYESMSFPGQGVTTGGGQRMTSGGQSGRPGGGGGRSSGGSSGRAAGGPGPVQASSSPSIIWLKDIRLAAQK